MDPEKWLLWDLCVELKCQAASLEFLGREKRPRSGCEYRALVSHQSNIQKVSAEWWHCNWWLLWTKSGGPSSSMVHIVRRSRADKRVRCWTEKMGCLERNNDLLQAWENPVFVTATSGRIKCVVSRHRCLWRWALLVNQPTHRGKSFDAFPKCFLLLPLLELCECGQVTVDGKQRRPRRVT